MDLQGYLRAVRKGWWLLVTAIVLGIAAAALFVVRATPVYEASLTFYVGTPASSGTADPPSAQSTDLYLQSRATSYAELASSEKLAQMVVATAHLDLAPSAVAGRIAGAAKLNTVLFGVTVDDPIPARAQVIGAAIAKDLPVLASGLDGSAGSKTAPRLTLVSGPAVASTPVSPRTTLDLAAGFAAGLVLGLVLAVLRELLDTAVRAPDQMAQLTGRPVLGEITFDGDARSAPLFVDEQGGSRRSEEFRHLRTNISFLDAVRPVNVLVVTSALAGEGKSTTATNLAVAMSETESRVLLIEADLRRPSAAAYLGLEGASGLTNVLTGQVDVTDVIQSWGGDRLSFLASGPLPPNPSELLGGARMTDLLTRLRSQFDMIIIDTPPLLPVTDAAVLARQADGVLVVVRHGKTTRNQVLQVLRNLETVDSRVLGTVLTMRPARGVDSAYDYGSGYYLDDDTLPRLDGAHDDATDRSVGDAGSDPGFVAKRREPAGSQSGVEHNASDRAPVDPQRKATTADRGAVASMARRVRGRTGGQVPHAAPDASPAGKRSRHRTDDRDDAGAVANGTAGAQQGDADASLAAHAREAASST